MLYLLDVKSAEYGKCMHKSFYVNAHSAHQNHSIACSSCKDKRHTAFEDTQPCIHVVLHSGYSDKNGYACMMSCHSWGLVVGISMRSFPSADWLDNGQYDTVGHVEIFH